MTIEMEYVKLIDKYNVEYASLMKFFVQVSKSRFEDPSVLNELKIHYSSVINSARTLDYIRSLEDLLRILEKRNELSHDNIAPLVHIESQYVRNHVLAKSLHDYQESLGHRQVVPLFNIYELPGGKYNDERNNIRENKRPVAREHLDSNHRNGNHDERTFRHFLINSDNSGYLLTRFAAEDTLLDRNDRCLCNHAVTIGEPNLNVSGDDDDDKNIFTAKRLKTTVYVTTIVTLIVVVYFFTMSLIRICDACLSEPSTSSQSGFSETSDSNREESSRPRIEAEMTFYTTPEPSFRLTLLGPVEVDPTRRNTDYKEAEVARAVFLEVSEKVGRHWRDVARFLGVTEHDIDEIDHRPQLPLKEKTLQALSKFQSKCDPPQWKSKLLRALEKARRRDLMEMVEDMWSRKY